VVRHCCVPVAPRPAAGKPAHVVITPTTARALANGTATVVMQLSPGQQVILIERAGGWVLVARDGKNLGYIEAKALAKLD
jgi:Bacterial SH3 domain